MTILLCYHFGTFRNFKHNYIFFVKQHLKSYFPTAIFYNRFVELMPRVFFPLMIFMRLYTFGKCAGISFADSTMIPVYNNVRRYFNTVFADRGYIKQGLFEDLFEQGIHLVHGLKARMKNKLMPMYDKLLLRKRYIIECNELLKNKTNQAAKQGSIACITDDHCIISQKDAQIWAKKVFDDINYTQDVIYLS